MLIFCANFFAFHITKEQFLNFLSIKKFPLIEFTINTIYCKYKIIWMTKKKVLWLRKLFSRIFLNDEKISRRESLAKKWWILLHVWRKVKDEMITDSGMFNVWTQCFCERCTNDIILLCHLIPKVCTCRVDVIFH